MTPGSTTDEAQSRVALHHKVGNIASSAGAVRVAGAPASGQLLAELKPRHWDAFYEFYLATSDRKWGSAYLNRRFFAMIGERMPENLVLFMARRGANYVAGAFNLLGKDAIYGRNWGSYGEYKFLHFECCYYQAIEFAITRGLKRVEVVHRDDLVVL